MSAIIDTIPAASITIVSAALPVLSALVSETPPVSSGALEVLSALSASEVGVGERDPGDSGAVAIG